MKTLIEMNAIALILFAVLTLHGCGDADIVLDGSTQLEDITSPGGDGEPNADQGSQGDQSDAPDVTDTSS